MAPSVSLDVSDFNASRSQKPNLQSSPQILLLSPPSLSAHPEKVDAVAAAYDRSRTDIQMLDRLAFSHVVLPESAYDVVLILFDADHSPRESRSLLSREVLQRIVKALRPGGRLRSQDGGFAALDSEVRRQAILAGLVVEQSDMVKPDYGTSQPIPLRLGKKTGGGTAAPVATIEDTDSSLLNGNGKRQNRLEATQPAGVGFVDFSDDLNVTVEEEGDEVDLDDDDDEELIDENTLLSDEDMSRPIVPRKYFLLLLITLFLACTYFAQSPAPECLPNGTKKRRRACKDCTCGLAARLEAEDRAKRSTADAALAKLKEEDLAEVDFTVKGKVGSCGNCALGDAFRCEGCPYVGLPAFKVGQEIRLEDLGGV